MRADLEKWITDIGAEVRLRAQIASLDARTQRIDDLLKIIAEREISASAAKRVSTR
jgi:Asp-tRNA(Asn)/Glu-tRNA(Gln) amidotransferase B subunit